MAIRYSRSSRRDYPLVPWDKLITNAEASKKYGRTMTTLISLIKAGVIKKGIDCFKVGGYWIFDDRRLDEIFNETKEHASAREKELNRKYKRIPNIDDYNIKQKEQIMRAIEEEIGLSEILNKDYTSEQMKEKIDFLVSKFNL